MITMIILDIHQIILQRDQWKYDLKYLWQIIKPYLTWRILVAYGLAYMITNGWCYIVLGLGLIFKNAVLTKIGTGYLAFLWLPFTQEKLVTIPLSVWFYKKIFPKHDVNEILDISKKK